MAGQPFEVLLAGEEPLLPAAERVVVDGHRRWYAAGRRRGWSEPAAYRWLRYEDPDPVARLGDGVRRLPVAFGADDVDRLERLAAGLGRA